MTLRLEDEIDISRGEMIVHAPAEGGTETQPNVGRYFEAMLVWMDEEPMDASKSFFIKHTTNTSRCRIDHISYRVDVNTMEHCDAAGLALNEIGRVTIATAKELFFDAYAVNKPTGAFVIIDPVTNNTSASITRPSKRRLRN